MRNRARYSIPHCLAISAAKASLGFGPLTSKAQAVREASTILAASDPHDTVYDRRENRQDRRQSRRDNRQDALHDRY